MASLIKGKLRKAKVLLERGDTQAALRIAESVYQNAPMNPAALSLLGQIALHTGNNVRAIEVLSRVVRLAPGDAENQYRLGFAYMNQGQLELAAEHLRAATRLKPQFGEAYNRLCAVLGQLGLFSDAVVAGEAAIKFMPDSAVAQTNLGSAYEACGQMRAALVSRREAARLCPSHPVIQNCLGNSLAAIGDKGGAEQCYRKALALRPSYTAPYRLLTRLRRYTSPDDGDAAMIRRLLVDPSIPEAQRSDLHFGLAKIYDDCDMFDEAFVHFDAANKIENTKHSFDPDEFLSRISEIISVFTPNLFERKSDHGVDSDLPVFIVGMPRSGSTLVEQIIASHEDAYGGGELYWFDRIGQLLEQTIGRRDRYPECVRWLEASDAHSLAASYLDYLQKLAGNRGYARITDKMLGNFMHLGLIRLLYPRARVVHCRRHPLDTCLSIYKIVTPNSLPFAYNLENIATVYKGYRRLMRHWEAIMPGALLTIEYEELVRNQEIVIRRLLDFLGLSWDSRCLEFYAAGGIARTLSAAQVREPIHDRSIGRWQCYEAHLEPLRRVFEKDDGLLSSLY